MEKEEEYEDGKEEEYGKEQQEDLEKDDGGGGEEQQGGEGQVNPDEMEAGQGEQDEMEDGQGHLQKQQGWGHQGWWKRSWRRMAAAAAQAALGIMEVEAAELQWQRQGRQEIDHGPAHQRRQSSNRSCPWGVANYRPKTWNWFCQSPGR